MEEAVEFAPEDESEYETFRQEEDEASETFQISLANARHLGDQLLSYKSILNQLQDFQSDLKDLQTALEDKSDNDHSSSLAQLRALFSKIREQWAAADLHSGHPLHNEIKSGRSTLSTLEGDVSSARARGAPAVSTSITPTTSIPKDLEMKLPTIEVPTFHGDVMKWHSFWASFTAAVDSRKMPTTHKLAYLRKAIKDKDSQTLLYSPQEGPDFYPEAVAALKLRFDRKKEIHRKLVQNLISITPAKYNRTELRRSLDEYRYLMSSLKHTGHFDLQSVLSSHLYLNLPLKLQSLWDQHNSSNKNVSPIEDLMKFATEHTIWATRVLSSVAC